MNKTSRTITGIAIILLSLVLIIVSLFTTFFLLIYGVLALIVGLFILFNKKEDEIEERKDLNKKRTKK